MYKLTLAAVVLAFVVMAEPAEAAFVAPCGDPSAPWRGSCDYFPSGGSRPYDMDYSVTGASEQWDFWLEGNDDPGAVIDLNEPNQVFRRIGWKDSSGRISYEDAPTQGYSFTKILSPGRLTVLALGVHSYDRCANPLIFGICADYNNVWGNGTVLGVNSDRRGILRFSNTVLDAGSYVGFIPEPSTWAMMLMGFFGLGTVLRARKRKALATYSPSRCS